MIVERFALRGGLDYLSDGIEQWRDNWKVFAAIATPCALLSFMALPYAKHHLNPLWILLTLSAGLIRIVQYGAALCEVQRLQTGNRNTDVQREAGRAFRTAIRITFVWVWLLAAVPVAVGTVLLILPGLVLGVWLAFAPYALVYDNRRGAEALKYSRELSRGRFWPVANRLVIVGVVPTLAAFIAFAIARTILALFSVPSSLINWAFATLTDAAIVPLMMAAGGLFYRDLTAGLSRAA
jgi:hypothetical protein